LDLRLRKPKKISSGTGKRIWSMNTPGASKKWDTGGVRAPKKP
jgi:hypothetical protein